MLKFKKNIDSDTSITSTQYHSYTPYTQSYGYQDEIRIIIQSQNAYVLPHNSYIYIEGQFIRSATADDNAAAPSLISNFAAFLFDNIRYEMNGMEIDKCKNVGISSTLMEYASLTKADLQSLHAASIGVAEVAAARQFSLQIPVKLYMGFFHDYRHVIMNAKHELILTRSRNDTNCFSGANNIFAIVIDKIMWRMPHIKVDDYMQLKMLKQIESNDSIPVAYRSWDLYEYPALPQTTRHVWSVKTTSHLARPRYIILAFQTNRNNIINRACSFFDHIHLTDARLYLNSESYPQESLQLNFGQMKGAIAYNMYTSFKETYHHDGSGIPSNPIMSYMDWLGSPIFVFDCSRQNESLKISSVDVKIEFETQENVPALTTAFCFIVHDNVMQYNPLTNIITRNL